MLLDTCHSTLDKNIDCRAGLLHQLKQKTLTMDRFAAMLILLGALVVGRFSETTHRVLLLKVFSPSNAPMHYCCFRFICRALF